MALEANELCFKSTTLKEVLKELQDDKKHLIGLYGKRGSGKTTLVKAVRDEAKSLEIFDGVLFASVSQNPNIRMIQDQIAESMNLKFGNKSDYGRAENIKSSLANKKRVLVILDDVPTNFEPEEIGIPCSDRRCKLLLTTRHKRNCTLRIGKRVVRCQTMVPMSPLSGEDAWMLLKKLSGMNDKVAKEVALACDKFPRTIIDLASSFENKHIAEWKLLLNSLRHSTARYQIFLSFCRKDLIFVCNLKEELERNGFKTFMDHEPCTEDQISTKVIKAIEDSRLAIVVLSENYKGSEQCLEELVHILKCKESIKQLVQPIFYDLPPYSVSYENTEKIEEWKLALSQVSSFPGKYYRARLIPNDFIIKETVEIMMDTKHYLYIRNTDTDSDSDDIIEETKWSDGDLEGVSDQILVALEDNGLCFNSETLKELSKELQDDSVYTIGLHGPRGSGKTTLVEALHDKVKSLNIFDQVLFATLSQNPNTWSIQDQIARLLKLEFGKESKGKRRTKIESELESIERILVILDDVPPKFEPDEIGFPCNDERCKFLLTTRRKQDCSLMISQTITDCQKMISMRHLSKEVAWKLLQKHSAIDEDDKESLSSPLTVAKEIAFNYEWFPGTITEVGCSLKGKPYEEWQGLLNSLRHSSARFQIFLSFRGTDTRDHFTSTLNEDLKKNKFKTFMDDDQLRSGDSISTKLIKAIEDSRLSIVVLSENYPDSSWCLDELVHILECKESIKQEVWPIFYKVEPRDIARHQTKNGENTMAKLEEKFKNDSNKLTKWYSALRQVSKIKGFSYKEGLLQPIFIQNIIEKAKESKNYLYIQSMDMD